MTLKEAYSYAVAFLERNGIDEGDFKALCIVCSILGIKNSDYEAHKDDFVQNKKLADMLWKLKSGQPLQYVIGKWDFYESNFMSVKVYSFQGLKQKNLLKKQLII